MTTAPLPTYRACLVLVPLLSALLTGCATRESGRFPSLLPRAVETRSEALPEVTPAVAEPDPATDTAIAELRRTLDTTTAAFAPAAATAERLARAAKGTPVGGERWVTAQSALAELDGYRATTSGTLTDVDALAQARLADAKPDYPAITALQSDAQAAFDAQSARIAAISAMLPAD
jgi:hypothetical protein